MSGGLIMITLAEILPYILTREMPQHNTVDVVASYYVRRTRNCITVYGMFKCRHILFTTADVTSANTTISGRPCQRWDSQSPHIHPYSSLSSLENYCTNLNEDAAPWCYTTDEHHRMEFCSPPFSDCKSFSEFGARPLYHNGEKWSEAYLCKLHISWHFDISSLRV